MGKKKKSKAVKRKTTGKPKKNSPPKSNAKINALMQFVESASEVRISKGDNTQFSSNVTALNKVYNKQMEQLKREAELEEHFRKADEAYNNICTLIKDKILTNPENVEALKKMAREMIQNEKDHNLYNAASWQEILDLL